jgi:branched-chain amino acid transport system permease protein
MPAGQFRTRYEEDMALLDTPFKRRSAALFAGLLVILPWLVGPYTLDLVNNVALGVIVALGANLLTGVAGLASLGSAALLAVGAYTTAILAHTLGAPPWLALPAAVGAGALVGLVVALPALRLRGLYLVLSTLGLHFLVVYLGSEYQFRAALNTGIPVDPPRLFDWAVTRIEHWYYVLVAAATAATLFVRNLLRARCGRAWMAIRDRDVAAAALGVNVELYKVWAFVVSAALTAGAGSLWAYYTRVVNVEAFTLYLAIQYVAMIVVGGLGTALGAVLGAVFVVTLPQGIDAAVRAFQLAERFGDGVFAINYVVFGLCMGGFLLAEPRGLAGIWQRVRDYFLLWPFRYRSQRD